MNATKTTLVLVLLSGLLVVGGRAVAGQKGMLYGFLLAVGMNCFSYLFSEKLALASSRAQRVSKTEYPEIYQRLISLVRPLSQRTGLPIPKLWITPDSSPNAFAIGRNPAYASVAVSPLRSGLLHYEAWQCK